MSPACTRYPKLRPPLWATSNGVTSKPSTVSGVASMALKVQVPFSPSGVIGNAGGDIICDEQVEAGPTRLLGDVHVDPGVVTVAGGEERDPLHVVPVQVAEHDRAVEGRTLEQRGQRPDPGAGVQGEDRRGRGVRGDHDARGVPAVADEVRAWGGRGTTHPEEGQPHVLSSARTLFRPLPTLDL